jgi:hypothetical protein
LLETKGIWMNTTEKHRITFTIFKFISLYLLVLSHYEMAVKWLCYACDRNYSSRFSYFNQNIFSSPYYTFLDFSISIEKT